MTEPKNDNNQKYSPPGANKPLGIVLCLGALAGVLIWAKLRLVTDIPRSAYADPRETTQSDPDDIDRPEHHMIGEDTAGPTSHNSQP